MSKLETNTIDNISGSSTLTIGDSNASTISIPKNITLGASGTTITVPSGATITNNGTQTGFGGANTPYFWGRNGSLQALSNDTITKLNATTERVDSDNNYASSRFTPTTAGDYFIFGGAYLNSEVNSNLDIAQVVIYKNGSAISSASSRTNFRSNGINQSLFQISTIIDMNGSSDYVELYGLLEAGDATGGLSGTDTFFGGYKLIG